MRHRAPPRASARARVRAPLRSQRRARGASFHDSRTNMRARENELRPADLGKLRSRDGIHRNARRAGADRARRGSVKLVIRSVLVLIALAGCTHVRPSQREKLANPSMQFQMDPAAEGQRDSILEITEGGTYSSAGPGTAGAGCGCN